MEEYQNEEDKGSVALGIFLAIGLHVSVAGGSSILLFGGIPIFAIGLVQLVYIIPAALYFNTKGKVRTMQGLWLAAVVTFLVNAACYGYFVVTFA
ncbi:hypothetical protein [Aneurinibacillus uraniidurans]|uniref:hypothetical protein n=1 Tax=Aneurinibacillus uraniidurans TaxID=2966586 RepID=UPI00234BE204|nr:hypothetical protein [Aneurinibacillus sp. B1]WCN37172.1 hypothetical protein PO771_15180 [Aneurinibacillus sp. B1]